MKKLLSFVLVLAMVLGCVSMSFAATYSDMSASKYATAVDTLSNLGVVDGFTDGTFGPEKTLTRAQMAKLLVCALALDPAAAASTSFSDVAVSAWFAPYVELAAQLGIVNGYPDGTFKPEKVVSNTEAIVMVVRALGYTDAYFGGYNAAKYINKAMGLKVMNNVVTGTAGSTRGNAVQLIYNVLDTPIVNYVDAQNNPYNYSSYMNQTGSNVEFDTMMMRLAGLLYKPTGAKAGDAFTYVAASDQKVAEGVNMTAYLGKNIVAYANKENEILGVKEVKSTTLSGKFDGTYFVVGDVKYDITSSLAATATNLIKNGDVNGTAKVNAYTTTTVALEAKVSGKTIKDVYSLNEWTAASTFIFKSGNLDTKNFKLLSYTFAKNDDKEIDATKFALLGVDKLEDIAVDNVVTVYLNPNNSNIVKIEVGTATVAGQVSSKTSDGKYMINGTKYESKMTDAIALGSEATFLLGYDGKIYGSKDLVSSTKYYGVALEFAVGSTGITEKDAKVQIYTTDGEKVIFVGDDTAAKDGAWAYTTTDKAIVYTKTDDGQIHTITGCAVATLTNLEVAKNGALSGAGVEAARLDATTKILNRTGAGKYAVVAAADLYSTTVKTVSALVVDKGVVTFMVIEGSSTASDTYVLFNGFVEQYAKDGNYFEASVLKNGAADTMKLTSTFETSAAIATNAAVLRKITLDAGKISTAAALTGYTSVTVNSTATAIENGNILMLDLTLSGKSNYVLSDDLVVYVWNATDKVWEVGTQSDLLLSSGAAFKLYKTDSKTNEVTYATVVK